MSDVKNDGGSAFPVPGHQGHWGNAHATAPGMTLRDYFAAKALVGLLACNDGNDYEDERLRRENYETYCTTWAESAYAMADAMLKERAK